MSPSILFVGHTLAPHMAPPAPPAARPGPRALARGGALAPPPVPPTPPPSPAIAVRWSPAAVASSPSGRGISFGSCTGGSIRGGFIGTRPGAAVKNGGRGWASGPTNG